MTRPASWTKSALSVFAGAAMLFGIGLINGRPAVFWDTDEYYSQGEYVASRLHLAPPPTGARLDDPTSVMPDARRPDHEQSLVRAGGRSPFYGLFLFMAHAIGTLWLLSFLQALAVSWFVMLLTRGLSPDVFMPLFHGVMALLAVGTSVPFFTAFAMPDVFSGIGIICVSLILARFDTLSRAERFGAFALLVACLTFHKSNVATTLGLAIFGMGLLVSMRWRVRVTVTRGAVVLGAIACAVFAMSMFGILYRLDTGLAQKEPPFLMARLIADGPGHDYLRSACPGGVSPSLCPFVRRPLVHEEDILWSFDPYLGVYSISDHATQARMKDEEPAFVRASIAFAPIAQLKASAANWVEQLSMIEIVEPFINPRSFLHTAFWSDETLESLVPGTNGCENDERACEPRLSGLFLKMVRTIVMFLSLASLIRDFLRVGPTMERSDIRARASLQNGMTLAVLLVFGVVFNAAVCGIISGPFMRYNARVVWLIPVAAVILRYAFTVARMHSRSGACVQTPN